MLHIAAAGVGFLGLVAACFVIASRFASTAQHRWALSSRITGIVFLASFFGVATGSNSPIAVLGFWVALLAAWGWMASLAVHFYRRTADLARPA